MIHGKVWRTTGATLVLVCTAGISLAQSPTPAERAIEYRQAVYKVVAGNFGPLAQNAQGKLELAPGAARKHADRLAAIAEFTRDAFPDISKEGKTKAKPEIWTDRAEFDKLLNDFNNAARALATVTARADARPEDFKTAVGAVGNTCKGCHDKFREK
jgi:cytochrome c556